ncbi:MAG TPA: cytochrome c3 family protein [Anaeromyxobacteraceae bacterium]|nr:cytochrome c3 family protein [Anaeromyxobacteraceae bacterium]
MKAPGPTLAAKAGGLAIAGWVAAWLLALGALAAWRGAVPLAPAQPIAFPHVVHAGRLGLQCTFCHVNAPRSPEATVPPLSTCMTCHETIALDRPEVQKLRGYVARGEPVTWTRVHTLPDWVRFTHKRHVRAGVDCSACHGGVAQMARVTRVRPLTMGWCIGCHRTRGAPTDCTTCHV